MDVISIHFLAITIMFFVKWLQNTCKTLNAFKVFMIFCYCHLCFVSEWEHHTCENDLGCMFCPVFSSMQRAVQADRVVWTHPAFKIMFYFSITNVIPNKHRHIKLQQALLGKASSSHYIHRLSCVGCVQAAVWRTSRRFRASNTGGKKHGVTASCHSFEWF